MSYEAALSSLCTSFTSYCIPHSWLL